ncbi:hypothetical protein [Flavobacterium sp.]|uniref:hypothetical protein n=1 Tax=Flavobacterium sp. TaxID=239 RepID=UPI002606AD3B|nr:hypothetical protein [Flavobacterium sp.]MDD3003452.1 hypothetical protein [Flavobacterium sp.]
MKDPKIKKFSLELETIQQFENFEKQKVTIQNCDGEAFITKSKRDFQLSFDGVFKYQLNKKINVNIEGEEFTLKSIDFKEPINEAFSGTAGQHTFDIDSVYKGCFEKVALFKMFFFDNSKQNHIFHYKLETAKNDGVNTWAFECVRLSVNTNIYYITQYKNKDKSYFVIENLEPISLEEFNEDSYAIQKGIGFLIGYMPGGQNYIFSGDNFIYQRLARKSLKSIFHPVTSNPYSKLHKEKNIADIYYGKLKVIPIEVISNFITQLRNNEDYAVAIIFLMEVTHLKSVVSMPGVFSVILESLANIIITKQNTIEKLIANETLFNKIKSDLNAVLDNYAIAIDENEEIKFRRKINGLSNSINHKRLTNAEKLRQPFDQLQIKLSREDEVAIDFRNDLLHGNILMNNKTTRTSKEIDNKMLYASAKLYTLISKLILKNGGYNGYVINYAKFINKDANEDYFEEI